MTCPVRIVDRGCGGVRRDVVAQVLTPAELSCRTAVLDGELVVGAGTSADFYALTPRMALSRRRAASGCRVTFVAFDLLFLDVQHVCALSYVERRAAAEPATVRAVLPDNRRARVRATGSRYCHRARSTCPACAAAAAMPRGLSAAPSHHRARAPCVSPYLSTRLGVAAL